LVQTIYFLQRLLDGCMTRGLLRQLGQPQTGWTKLSKLSVGYGQLQVGFEGLGL
jgi:hypothetical protein